MRSIEATRRKRKQRIRAKLFGTEKKPRLSVFRSNKHISAQLIDDERGRTLVSASQVSLGKLVGKVPKSGKAELVGKTLAQKAQKKGINQVVFDRGPYRYHGRIKNLADGARKGGLKF